ncbi:MAG TPA: DUF4105 domain-containing protein [Thermoguttaceae bacterium]|nr:DUF4105 domain-containing protein [Thermoguttaceae bacterium]
MFRNDLLFTRREHGGAASWIRFASAVAMAVGLIGCAGGPGLEDVLGTGYQPMSLELDSTLAEPATHPLVSPLRPSNDRDWSPEQAVLARAEFDGDRVTIRRIRNFRHVSENQHEAGYYDRAFRLSDIRSVDFLVVPFASAPDMAHTMLSFGFEGDQYVTVSVEARREKGETYDSILGLLDRFELIYVVGDERDLIQLRTNVWLDDVYLYRTQASPEQARTLFLDVMHRVNQLAKKPEFYNTLTNNCTTNIIAHVNRLSPGRVPFDQRILLNGRSDRLAYDLGLLSPEGSFEELKAKSRVNYAAYLHRNQPDFSALIRQ